MAKFIEVTLARKSESKMNINIDYIVSMEEGPYAYVKESPYVLGMSRCILYVANGEEAVTYGITESYSSIKEQLARLT